MLINITGGEDLALFEVDEITNKIRAEVDPEAEIINGSIIEPTLEGKIRVSIVATALDGQLPESKSVINMVHRIQNRNPGYSDFSNIASSQSFEFSNTVASPITEGATALKLENEVQQETMSEEEKTIVSDETTNESILEETKLEDEQHADMQEEESISNGLENFEIEAEAPELFNPDNNENESSDNEFASFENSEKSEEENDLEIPAFLRRQKN